MPLQHLRSSTANKRPIPSGISDGQLAVNSNLASPGLFFKDSNGDLVKTGPVHVGTTAPNATPAVGGQTGNSKGEQWLDTSSSRYVHKIWDGTAWRTEDGEFVNASGDTMTGTLVMDNQQQVRFRETTANGTNFIAIQAPASVVADRTLTLPDVTGTMVSTGDTGTVTSTMILDGTIVNADINASAAIVDTKFATIATAGKVSNSATTATNANTASAIVARDASGNFTAGTITAALTGAASSNVLKAGDTMTGALVVPLASASTPSLTFTGDLNTGIYSPGADQLAVTISGVECARIDSGGRLLVGTNSYRSVGDAFFPTSVIFNEGSGVVDYQILAGVHNRAGTEGPSIALGKSRGTANGSVTIVQDGDHLGEIAFAGADGVDLATRAALIRAEVDGTPGANDMPGRLTFSTTIDGAGAPTERMRINSAGAVFVNTTTNYPGAGNTSTGFMIEALSAGTSVFTNRDDNPSFYSGRNSDGVVVSFTRSGTGVGNVSVTSTTTSFNSTSDYRLKENIVPIANAIPRLQSLQPSRFNFIVTPGQTVDGFLAHEAQAVVPECVTGTKDAVDEDGNPVYQGIDQSKLVPLLTAALQEAITMISALEARISALEV